jgi:hypothetical protein
MSLIPSESNSFADLLGRGLDGSKKSKWRAAASELPEGIAAGPPVDSKPAKKPKNERPKKKAPPVSSERVEAKKQAPAEEVVQPPLVDPVPPEPSPPTEAVPPAEPETFFPPPELPPVQPSPPILPPISAVTSPPEATPLIKAPLVVQPEDEPTQPIPIVPPVSVLTSPAEAKPLIKAPLVVQPEDEPPRRPIPIVRIARSRLNPNGNHREPVSEVANGNITNGDTTNGNSVMSVEPAATQPAVPRPRARAQVRLQEAEAAPQVPPGAPASKVVFKPQPESLPQALPLSAKVSPASGKQEPSWVENDHWVFQDQPRRRKIKAWWKRRFTWFVVCEFLAVLFLLGAVLVGLAHHSPDDPLNLETRHLAIGAALMTAIIPILFYGLPERFPRDRR